MANNSRQILIHLHSEDNRAPSGSILTHGEIAVSHNNLKDAALYTKIDDENVAKFISEIEVDTRISAATEILNDVIDSVEAFSGLTESGHLVDAKVIKDVIVDNEEVTSAALNDLNDRLEVIEASAATKAEVEALDDRVTDNEEVTSAALNDLNDRMTDNEEVTSAALNDLNNRLTYIEVSGSSSSDLDALSASVVTLSAQTVTIEENLDALSGHVLTTEYVVSTAINDLNDRIIDLYDVDCGTYS